MEAKIRKMFFVDRTLIITSLAFLWVVLVYVMTVVAGMTDILPAQKIVALGAGIIAGVSATIGLVALISHLKNNKTELYTEDITCAPAMGEEK
ncbi:hypothetical protein [Dehalobacterium formicoaceticum]|uniref:Uncharacterized protein n=1 Tax=Dehalobacterium formicoaceticum TaxID=51515 RepID=A0ABT1Y3R1_9FIRM|nr:hypothetical protein [Dehalobacterium formicoaceticum]MCR6544554.1 hypothetical protein [Dehalobacterium formicoaceticum]